MTTALFEVLSESTEGYDRGKKLRNYRSVATFREQVLVAQDAGSVERCARGDDGGWSPHESSAEERLVLASIGQLSTASPTFAPGILLDAGPA